MEEGFSETGYKTQDVSVNNGFILYQLEPNKGVAEISGDRGIFLLIYETIICNVITNML
jgi:hypothetical protein